MTPWDFAVELIPLCKERRLRFNVSGLSHWKFIVGCVHFDYVGDRWRLSACDWGSDFTHEYDLSDECPTPQELVDIAMSYRRTPKELPPIRFAYTVVWHSEKARIAAEKKARRDGGTTTLALVPPVKATRAARPSAFRIEIDPA